jgi:hypothetical protein
VCKQCGQLVDMRDLGEVFQQREVSGLAALINLPRWLASNPRELRGIASAIVRHRALPEAASD